MRIFQLIFIYFFIFAVVSNISKGYKILGVFPLVFKSHFIFGEALMKSLAEKGHEVTVISPYTMKDKNYRGIEVPSLQPAINEAIKDFMELSLIKTLKASLKMGMIIANLTLSDPSVQKLMKSGENFDIIVMDILFIDALFGFTELFNASMIGTGLSGAWEWNTDLVGTPSPPSYVPTQNTALTDHMNLLGRIGNLAMICLESIIFDIFHHHSQKKLFKKYFPNSKTTLDELKKKTALVLLNQHVSLSFPRPYLPNMIEVGGLHINRKRNPLPADMQKFLDEAKDGAIYFSMGTTVKSKYLPVAKREAILSTFKSLKQRVLWKFEDTNLPGKSDNVFISDWFPQDDVLAHPNIKMFITHGGLLSTTESIYHGKPFIGIPIFGDQFINMARAVAKGVGIVINYNLLNENNLKSTITEMFNNPKYTNMVQDMSRKFRDQPMEPMELAIYWVEYIARHKGAPHLHCAAQELNFIQYHNIDAIVILFGGIPLIGFGIVTLIVKILLHLVGNFTKKSKIKTN